MKLLDTIGKSLSKTGLSIKKHSPEILIVGGVVGVVASAVMACRATTKVKEVIDSHKADVAKIHELVEHPEQVPVNEVYTKQDAKKDLTITYAQTGLKLVRLYAPSVILGALSLTCVVTSNNILRKRNAAIAAAYTAVDSGFKNYRSNVIERFGEEVDKELRHGIKAKEIEEVKTDKDGKEKKVKTTVDIATNVGKYSDYARVYDDGCEGWQKDAEHNLWFLRQQEAWANQKLKTQGYLFLNDVYDMLGIPRSQAGQVVGWLYNDKDPNHEGDNYVDFGIYNINLQENRDFINGYERTIVLDFNVDGIIYDKI